MGLSKSVRFEVFARDAFTCQYCGRRPPEVILECDHIHPRSKGGENDLLNLVTSCADCNRGKSAKVISEVAPRPDADLAFLKTQQEIVEVQRFLKAKKKQDRLHEKMCDTLREIWTRYLTPDDVPTSRVFIPWVIKYGADEVSESIAAASNAYSSGQFGYHNEVFKLIKYVGAILRNRHQDPERWGVDVKRNESHDGKEERAN
jgi:hypothetical protein